MQSIRHFDLPAERTARLVARQSGHYSHFAGAHTTYLAVSRHFNYVVGHDFTTHAVGYFIRQMISGIDHLLTRFISHEPARL